MQNGYRPNNPSNQPKWKLFLRRMKRGILRFIKKLASLPALLQTEPWRTAVIMVAAFLIIFSGSRLIDRAIQDRSARSVNERNLALLQSSQTTDDQGTRASEATPIPTVSPAVNTAETTELPTEAPAENTDEATIVAQATVEPTVLPTIRPTRVPANYKPEMLEKFQALYAANQDTVGWLRSDAIYRINFVVVHGKNAFYEKHDFYGNNNANGTAFLDETNSAWPKDEHLMIYAHNMRTGEMFGELNRLASASRLLEHPFFYFDTIYEEGIYIPVAVYVCSVNAGTNDYFQFYVRNFQSATMFDEYIARARELSSVSLKTDVHYGDELLSLVTCYDSANTQRFVVLLRKLRENETMASAYSAYFAQ